VFQLAGQRSDYPQSRGLSYCLPTIWNRKNLISLLQAAASLRTRYPRLLLVLYGRAAITPERETAFESRARELGLDGAFERTGALDDRVLRQLYQQCTLFVFPSLYEGFGLPLLEAMACSACVVARSASAMAEVVGDAGTLVETRDPDVLADSIRKLLDNPLKCEELRTAALHRARLFTIDRMAGLTYRSYCTALDIKNDDAPLP
jgi:glycosyltransferase involved in cell wall biosynthesis